MGSRAGSLKALLDLYKFQSARQAHYVAAELLDAALPMLPEDTVVVPVPTAAAHQRYRGFDHTSLIARRLAKLRGLSCEHVLATESSDIQHFKTKQQRLRAAGSGLRIIGAPPQRILLIDDIFTTGSTVSACSLFLRQHGAKYIAVAVIARQTLDASADL